MARVSARLAAQEGRETAWTPPYSLGRIRKHGVPKDDAAPALRKRTTRDLGNPTHHARRARLRFI